MYPQRFAEVKIDEKFKKIVELLRELHINIHFTKVITNMPSYAKLLKEIMTNKQNLDDTGIIALTVKCSVVIQNKISHKLKDPRSFSIPVSLEILL